MKSALTILSLLILLSLNSCGEKSGASGGDGFDAAYPAMYTDLGLPQYRRGTLQNVTGKDEGVKTVHTFTVVSEDPPSFLREFFSENMKALGWRDQNARRQLSEIHEDDLYFAKYVKGRNKLDISSSALPEGGSKTRVTLSVFGSN
ncbi:hypothetical protein [Portibacter marinus]|uniref:hypothetical protein n=1 Tax=Portibacter marinus TaxID=2898660 RepID=UPI001F27927B|nr:hypothetical protein [Portibacter marinus]